MLADLLFLSGAAPHGRAQQRRYVITRNVCFGWQFDGLNRRKFKHLSNPSQPSNARTRKHSLFFDRTVTAVVAVLNTELSMAVMQASLSATRTRTARLMQVTRISKTDAGEPTDGPARVTGLAYTNQPIPLQNTVHRSMRLKACICAMQYCCCTPTCLPAGSPP
jgi:hypothetical protein